jgi:hypothetical protein
MEWDAGVTDVASSEPPAATTTVGRTAKMRAASSIITPSKYTFADGTCSSTSRGTCTTAGRPYWDYVHDSKGSAVLMATIGGLAEDLQGPQHDAGDIWPWELRNRTIRIRNVVEWQLLLDAIRKNKPYNEARRVGEAEVTPMMGRMATHNGQSVTWDQAMNSQFQFVADIDHMTFDTPAPIHAGPDGLYAPTQRESRRSAEFQSFGTEPWII